MRHFGRQARGGGRAEQIRRAYLQPEDERMAQLRALDLKLKRPGCIAACILGGVGALTMGGGLSLVLADTGRGAGIALGAAGLLLVAAAYPVCQRITERRRTRFADEILRLRTEIIGR